MNLDLRGSHALVCGSSQGMGKAIAIQLAEMGASITLFARNKAKLDEVKSQLSTEDGQQHHVLVADFGEPQLVKEAIEQHLTKVKRIEILINNTGGPAVGLASESTDQEYLAVFNQHLINNHNIAQALLPGMKVAKFGRIINVTSTAIKQPQHNLGTSNTARAAVASWAKTMATELGQFNITVNNVLPGATKTNRLETYLAGRAKDENITVEQATENFKSVIPMKRFGEAQEFANAVAFLASKSASYINGINLPVDGGRTSSL